MKCTQCGADLTPGARFCPGCGAPQQKSGSPRNQGKTVAILIGAVGLLLLLVTCSGIWLMRDTLLGPGNPLSQLVSGKTSQRAVQETETARAALAQGRATRTARARATTAARTRATATAQSHKAATARALTTVTAMAQKLATMQAATTAIAQTATAQVLTAQQTVMATGTAEAQKTAQAQATATAQAATQSQATVIAQIAAQARATAAALATAQAKETAVAQVTAESQATAQAQATAIAQVTVEAQATAQAQATARAQATKAAAAKTATAVAQNPPTPTPTETPSQPVPATLQGRIAFPVFAPDRGTYDIYVANADGSNMQRTLDYASQPALSPDGLWVALRRWKSDDRGVEIMNTYGGNQKRLTNFLEDALPSWSPDGRSLVFFSRRESDRRARLYEVDVTGGADRVLKSGAGPVYGEFPTWMPNGQILYTVTSPQHGLATINADGSGFHMVFADGSATASAPSPDGAHIAFMSQRDGNWEIYRINADGSGLLRLTNLGANDGLPTWSPDGKHIAFVSDRGGTWAIWAINADGGAATKLFNMPGSPDGHVRNQPDFSSRGWLEERISWGP